MRTFGNRIIVKANVNQKEELVYKSLKLYIPNRAILDPNGRVANPTLCEVVASSSAGINEGDLLILGHNSINNPAWLISEEDGIKTLCIEVDRWILGKIGSNGELIPLNGNTVCKRIGHVPVSSIIITPDAYKTTEENKVIVLAVSPEIKDIKEGQTAVIHKHSDYEIFWSAEVQERSAVIVFQKDVVAIA